MPTSLPCTPAQLKALSTMDEHSGPEPRSQTLTGSFKPVPLRISEGSRAKQKITSSKDTAYKMLKKNQSLSDNIWTPDFEH